MSTSWIMLGGLGQLDGEGVTVPQSDPNRTLAGYSGSGLWRLSGLQSAGGLGLGLVDGVGVTVATSSPVGFQKGPRGAMKTGLPDSPAHLAPRSDPNPSRPLGSCRSPSRRSLNSDAHP